MRAHQPGSTPIQIPETVPNPAYTPEPTPTPERPPAKVPEKVPEKVSAPRCVRHPFWSMTSRKAKRENSIPMHGVIKYCNTRNGMHAPPFAKTHPKIIVAVCPDQIPCSCTKTPCFSDIIPCSLRREFRCKPLNFQNCQTARKV
jgi:hypothetical protein